MKKRILAISLCALIAALWAYSETTPRLGMRTMTGNVAHPDIIFNEMLYKTDALLFPVLTDYPAPADPTVLDATNGDLYIVPAGAEEDWYGHDNQLAVYQNAAWEFIQPATGFFVYKPGMAYYIQQRRMMWVAGKWKDLTRASYRNLYVGGDGFSYTSTLSIDYDSSLEDSNFAAIDVTEATTEIQLLRVYGSNQDPSSRMVYSDWPIRSASEFQIQTGASTYAHGWSGIIQPASTVTVVGGIIVNAQ